MRVIFVVRKRRQSCRPSRKRGFNCEEFLFGEPCSTSERVDRRLASVEDGDFINPVDYCAIQKRPCPQLLLTNPTL
jgi:hypothetical protein